MAAEAHAENPVPPAPSARGVSSASSPEKRALTVPADDDGGGEEEGGEHRLPELKRRRACVAALDSAPSAVAEAEGEGSSGDADGAASFSFQHARGGFLAPETTPKFGSFNPPGEDAEPAALDLKPVERGDGDGEEDSLEADEEVPLVSACPAEHNNESAQVVGDEVDGQVQTDQT